MTTRKPIHGYIPLNKRLARIKTLSKTATAKCVKASDDINFLAKALSDIAEGHDGKAALDIKARRGERRNPSKSTPRLPKHHGTLVQRINRLLRISHALVYEIPLDKSEREFLRKSLLAIAAGAPPEVALGTKSKSGKNKNHAALRKDYGVHSALPWIACAIEPCSTHPTDIAPMSLTDAVAMAATLFDVSEDHLRYVWTHAKPKPSTTFSI